MPYATFDPMSIIRLAKLQDEIAKLPLDERSKAANNLREFLELADEEHLFDEVVLEIKEELARGGKMTDAIRHASREWDVY